MIKNRKISILMETSKSLPLSINFSLSFYKRLLTFLAFNIKERDCLNILAIIIIIIM